MACAPKSNAATRAIGAAAADVREGRTIPVPKMLRDAHSAQAKTLGHGTGYVSPHDRIDGADDQEYLGVDRRYYEPTNSGEESEIRRRLGSLSPSDRADTDEAKTD